MRMITPRPGDECSTALLQIRHGFGPLLLNSRAFTTFSCCGCALSWPGPAATITPTETWRVATSTWRKRLASKDIFLSRSADRGKKIVGNSATFADAPGGATRGPFAIRSASCARGSDRRSPIHGQRYRNHHFATASIDSLSQASVEIFQLHCPSQYLASIYYAALSHFVKR
jgi:hypothetical protein